MVTVRPRRIGCGSWACPKCGKILGRAVSLKLQAGERYLRARGKRFVLVTLLVSPEKFPDGPAAALRSLGEKRAIARCVKAWADSRSLEVEYWRKLELHESGWPHFHLLLVVPAGLRFKNPSKGEGEFDRFWPHGFSNVSWKDGGESIVGYGSKVAAYATKEAGSDEDQFLSLEASGLPAVGFHWTHPSRGFWACLGVEPPSLAEVPARDDESLQDECCGRVPYEVGGAPGAGPVSHVDRVRACGWSSALAVDGGLQDESASVATKQGRFAVRLPCTRGNLGWALAMFEMEHSRGEWEFYEDRKLASQGGSVEGMPPEWLVQHGVLKEVRGWRPGDLCEFFDYLHDVGVTREWPNWESVRLEVHARLGLPERSGARRENLPLLDGVLEGL